jgi:hypothetical protein
MKQKGSRSVIIKQNGSKLVICYKNKAYIVYSLRIKVLKGICGRGVSRYYVWNQGVT